MSTQETAPSRLGADGARATARDFDDPLGEEGRRAASGARPLEQRAWSLAARVPHTARRVAIIVAAGSLTAAALGWVIAAGSGRASLPMNVDIPLIPRDREFEVALHYYTSEAGVTGVVAAVPEPTRISARLPDGWVSTGSGITNEPEEPEPPIAVSFWTVDGVFIEPCRAQGLHGADPPMMRSLDGLVDAFTLWWSADTRDEWWANPPPDLPSTTRRVDTTVSGFRARYFELRIPDTVDVESCSGGRYATWRNADNVERRHAPGDVSRLWIVEVGRADHVPGLGASTPLLVIDATSLGEASPEELRDLEDLIDSIRIGAPAAIP